MIPLSKVIEDHGLYHPHSMNNSFEYVITLPQRTSLMTGQDLDTRSHKRENMELEYETMIVPQLSAEVSSNRPVGHCNTITYEIEELDKASTTQNININLPRKSMRDIVLLFKGKILSDTGIRLSKYRKLKLSVNVSQMRYTAR